VLGCLVEKELTTPEQYPLTLNALTLACNQRSNRDPVLNFPEQLVTSAVTSAKTKGFVRFVHPSHGRSALRYAHLLGEALGVSERQLALLAVMILRGPQTPGELRARTDRMADFSDLDDLDRELDRLCGLDEPLVERLGRRPGQSQDRFRHLLGPPESRQSAETLQWPAETRPADSTGRYESTYQAPKRADSHIEQEISELRAEISELRGELADLRKQLGG